MDDRIGDLPDVELPIDYRYIESTPVLFGHYWLKGEPTITFQNAACGILICWEWDSARGPLGLLAASRDHVGAGQSILVSGVHVDAVVE